MPAPPPRRLRVPPARRLRFRGLAALLLGLLVLPGCGGGSRVAGGTAAVTPATEGSLVLQLGPEDTRRAGGSELPRRLERRWSGAGLLGAGGDAGAVRSLRVRVRVRGQGGTLRDGRIRLTARSLERPASASGPLPVARLRLPAVTISLVGRGVDGSLGHGLAQARLDEAFLAALGRLDAAATVDEALWLALLGLDAAALDAYRTLASPADAGEVIALREAGIGPARLAGRDAAGPLRPTPADAPPPPAPRLRLPPTPPGSPAPRVLPPLPAPTTPPAPAVASAPAAPAPPAPPASRPEPPAVEAPALPAPPAGGTPTADGPVPDRYAELMGQLGYTRAEELSAMHAARVEPRSVRDFLDAGHNPTAEELIAARAAGVDGAAALEMARAGYRFRLAEILELAAAGVTPAYAVGLVDPRYPVLTAGQLIDLKDRGVTAEEVRAIRGG